MIKVIHIIGSAKFGGIEKIVYDLSVAQNNIDGFHVDILFLKMEGELLNKFRGNNFNCFCGDLKNGYDLSINKYIKIYRLLKQYHVIHLHLFSPLLGLVLLFLKSKIVYTEHGVKEFNQPNKFIAFLKTYFQKYFMKWVAKIVTFNSHYTKDYWLKIISISKNKYFVIYNGIVIDNTNYFQITNKYAKQLSLNSFVVGTSSRFINWKRINLLIQAYHIFQKSYPDSSLLLVGDGNERSNLEDLVEHLKIGKNVVFTGYKKNIGIYQNLMDICVFPSTTETFGIVAIEALQYGKPTIVFSDGGGITEIIKKCFPEDVVNNIFELANRISYYHDNKTESDKYINTRRKYAMTFAIDKMVIKFHNIYNLIIS